MFFQTTTPDTSGYMIAGYIIAFVAMGIYIASIYIRNRNLKQDLSMLESLDNERKPNARVEPSRSIKSAVKKNS
jgi:hypothetical protein